MAEDSLPPDNQLGYLLTQVSFLKQRIINNALRNLDITYIQFVVLASILELEIDSDVVTQQLISNKRRLDKAMVSNVVKTLLQKALVMRQTNFSDKRAYCLTLTAEGKEIAAKGKSIALEIDGKFFAEIDNRSLKNMLLKLLENEETEKQ